MPEDPIVQALIVALESLLEFSHAALVDTKHDDSLRYFEHKSYAALALTNNKRYLSIMEELGPFIPDD